MADTQGCVRCICSPVIDAEFDEERDRPPSEVIVDAIATAEGVSPMELDPLSESIDLGAVDRLFERDAGSETGTVLGFTVDGWNVFVRDGGSVRICDPDRATSAAPVFEKPIAD
ncbi:MAG: HalOD1 output domain-containing protein [Haloarculaceae archaeon]